MRKYRKLPVVVEAKQWFKEGDHDQVGKYVGFVFPVCEECNKDYSEHGRVKTLEGYHVVCPGDWIIKGIVGEFYPCKHDVFEASYEEVEE